MMLHFGSFYLFGYNSSQVEILIPKAKRLFEWSVEEAHIKDHTDGPIQILKEKHDDVFCFIRCESMDNSAVQQELEDEVGDYLDVYNIAVGGRKRRV